MIWANNVGGEFLATGAFLRISKGRLTCGDAAQDPDLRAFVRNLDRASAVWVCRGDNEHLLVRGDLTAPAGLPEAVGLSFFPAHPKAQYLWGDFSKIFGLTAAEGAVLRRLIDGDRVEAIASNMGVSVETTRTHIRRSYNKLGVGSREELFSAISPFRVR